MSLLQDPTIFEGVLDNLQVGIFLVDLQWRILFWNLGAESISGYLRQEVLGRPCREDILIHDARTGLGHFGASFLLLQSIRDAQPKQTEAYLLHRSGARLPVQLQTVPVRNRDGVIIGAAAVFQQYSFTSTSGPRPRFMADAGGSHTPVVKNQASCELILREELARCTGRLLPFSVLLIEVDRLDTFAARHGREAGEAILDTVGRTIANTLGHVDFLGRWSSNRFLAVVMNCHGKALEKLADHIRRIVCHADIDWWGDRLSVTVSVGGSDIWQDDTLETLLERAAGSLEQSLNRYGDSVTVFQEEQ